MKSLFPVLLLQFIEFIQFLLFLVIFSLAAFIFLFCLYFFFVRMLPKTNEIISVVCIIQRLVQLGGNLQLVSNCRITPVCVVKTHTLYNVIIQRFCFISPYILFYFDFQTIENQCVLFFLLVKYQFKDSGFKSLRIIMPPVKIGDEFLLVKRKSIIGHPIIIYPVEFSV